MRKPLKPAKRRITWELPEPLYLQLRDRAAAESETMRRIAIDALRAHLAQPREEATR